MNKTRLINIIFPHNKVYTGEIKPSYVACCLESQKTFAKCSEKLPVGFLFARRVTDG